jgi:uncharacterized integral membrane protein (TIGR00697 family)
MEQVPTRPWRYLDLFASVFIACLLAANIIAVKIFVAGPFTLPAGTIVFPISYIVNDVLTEVYGFQTARLVICLGFLANLLLVIAIVITQHLPGAPFWDGQEAFEQILGFTPRLLLASFTAYLIGSLSNAWVMVKMKPLTRGRWLWTRTIGSTIVGEGLDSLLFIVIAFTGVLSVTELTKSAASLWLVKTLYEAVATPLTYVVVNRVKSAEGVETDDKGRSEQIG